MIRSYKRYSNLLTLERFHSGKEIFKERVINVSTFGMILDRQRKRVIPQAHLLDDIVIGAPRFDFETICDMIDRLVVRTVHPVESMLCGRVVSQ